VSQKISYRQQFDRKNLSWTNQ